MGKWGSGGSGGGREVGFRGRWGCRQGCFILSHPFTASELVRNALPQARGNREVGFRGRWGSGGSGGSGGDGVVGRGLFSDEK